MPNRSLRAPISVAVVAAVLLIAFATKVVTPEYRTALLVAAIAALVAALALLAWPTLVRLHRRCRSRR